MNILIAGAGIGGLVAALSLHDGGLDDLRVIDAARELRPLGAGVNLRPNAVRELAALGLYRPIADVAVPIEEVHYHNQHGDLISREQRGRGSGYHWPQLAVRRGALQGILAEAVRTRLGEHRVRAATRVTGATAVDGGVRVDVLRDGEPTTFEADVLIGADGLHSAVRRAVSSSESAPVWNGMVVWRGMTWAPPPARAGRVVIAGDGVRKVVLYPVAPPRADGQVLLNWAVSVRHEDHDGADRTDWNRPVPAAKVAAGFPGWRVAGIALTDLFEGADSCFEYPLLDRDPLPTWSSGTTTLLGDAAHAMHPMGSNATTQAVVDARALAYFLATDPDPARAIAAYERHRRPVTSRIQLANRAMGPEAVIDLVAERAPAGFAAVTDVVPSASLDAVGDRYAVLAGFDRDSVNRRSPYDIRRARLVDSAALGA
ncbi:FAD-dependent monooxygenase [Actinokineospora sp. NBRC 105648]|uniref:FAD-dependent monooxygenase n=1 Tax=Actinokineospora sp. NBRC 105648 TaxID=3032206 RepID=UPI002554FCF3|nr:FAD-dependent monooxygenase [Actinokineospora sp. NBRC 105648]